MPPGDVAVGSDEHGAVGGDAVGPAEITEIAGVAESGGVDDVVVDQAAGARGGVASGVAPGAAGGSGEEVNPVPTRERVGRAAVGPAEPVAGGRGHLTWRTGCSGCISSATAGGVVPSSMTAGELQVEPSSTP